MNGSVRRRMTADGQPRSGRLFDAMRACSQDVRPLARQGRSPRFIYVLRPPNALPAAGPLLHGPHLEADICAWQNHRTPTSGFDIADGSASPLAPRSVRSCVWTAAVEAHHGAIRSPPHSLMKAENWFQLRIVGVTKKTGDSDSGRSPLVRCGKYVSRASILDLAPVQVRDTFSASLSTAHRRRSPSVSSGSDSMIS